MRSKLVAGLLQATPTVVLAALYGAHACRTVGPGDSGELTVVMSQWGVAHAPGYPLLSLLGNLACRLAPGLEAAQLLNLLNAVLTAIACGILGQVVARVTGSRMAAAFTTLAVGTGRVMWEYALVNEVFALNTLAAALLLWCLARVETRMSSERLPLPALLLAGLVMSLALTHHLTLALIAIPVLLALIGVTVARRGFGVAAPRLAGVVAAATTCGLLGLLPVVYLPLAARAGGPLVWGDPSTFSGTVALMMRRDFGSSALMNADLAAWLVLINGEAVSPVGFAQGRLFLAELPRSFGYLTTVLLGVGAVWSAFKARTWAFVLAGFAGLLLLFFARVNTPLLPLHIGVTERFWILPHAVLGCFAGFGFCRVDLAIGRLGRPMLATWRALAVASTLGIAVLWPGQRLDMSDDSFTRDLGANLLVGLPDGALILGQGDMLHNAFHYQRDVLGKRADVDWLDLQKVTYEWGLDDVRRRARVRLPSGMRAYDPKVAGSDAKALLDANYDHRPIVVTRLEDGSHAADYELVPKGLWSIVTRRTGASNLADRTAELRAIVDAWELRSMATSHGERSWERSEGDAYLSALLMTATWLDALGRDFGTSGLEAVPEALPYFDRARRLAHGRLSDADVLTRRALLTLNLVASGALFGNRATGASAFAVRLAETSLEAQASQADALKVLVSVTRSRSSPGDRDLRHAIDIQGRVVDAMPGDAREIDRYLTFVNDHLAAAATPESRGVDPKVVEEALRRQVKHLAHLDAALAVSDHPYLRQRRTDMQRSLANTRALQERLVGSGGSRR